MSSSVDQGSGKTGTFATSEELPLEEVSEGQGTDKESIICPYESTRTTVIGFMDNLRSLPIQPPFWLDRLCFVDEWSKQLRDLLITIKRWNIENEEYLATFINSLDLSETNLIISLLAHEFENIFPGEEVSLLDTDINNRESYINLFDNPQLFQERVGVIMWKLWWSIEALNILQGVVEEFGLDLSNHNFSLADLCVNVCGFDKVDVTVDGNIPENIMYIINRAMAGIAIREVLRNAAKHHARNLHIHIAYDEASGDVITTFENDGDNLEKGQSEKPLVDKEIQVKANQGNGLRFISSRNDITTQCFMNKADFYGDDTLRGVVLQLRFKTTNSINSNIEEAEIYKEG
jgi:hypothetical protein